MSLVVPSIQDISDNVVAQIEAQVQETIPLLPKAFSRVLAKAIAGVFVLLYKYAGFLLLQMFVRHATMAETTVNGKVIRPLLEWGRLIGVPDPTVAERAHLMASVSVLVQTGSIPSGTRVLRAQTGIVYKVVADVALNAATVFVGLIAASDPSGGDGSGEQGNLPDGSELEFASPVPNVIRQIYVTSTVTEGSDAESTESYRTRVIQKFQKRPQGGAYADYQEWGEEVSGIVAVYPYTSDNPGEVDLYVEATPASSGSSDGVPTSGQLDEVIASCNLDEAALATRRPANAALNALPIFRTGFDVVISGFEIDDASKEAGVKTTIQSALDDYFWSREPYIVGLSVPPRRDRITRAAVSGIVDTIVNAELGAVTSVEVKISGDDIAAYALDKGEKAKTGTVSYA